MGIFDRFKSKDKQQETNSNYAKNVNYGPKSDMEYLDQEGETKVRFGGIVDKEGKYLQEVFVDRPQQLKPGEAGILGGEKYLMEPYNLTQREDGKLESQTKEYYKAIMQKSENAIKTFFKAKDVNSFPTDYIGEIVEIEGGLRIKMDMDFQDRYKQALESERKNTMAEVLKQNTYDPNAPVSDYSGVARTFDVKTQASIQAAEKGER